MTKETAVNKGAQWPIAAGGGALGANLLAGYETIGELPGGAILQRADMHIIEVFDGTTPTVQLVYTDLDGANPVELIAASDADAAVDHFSAPDLVAINQLTSPKLLKIKGVAADSTAGEVYACVNFVVVGKVDYNVQ